MDGSSRPWLQPAAKRDLTWTTSKNNCVNGSCSKSTRSNPTPAFRGTPVAEGPLFQVQPDTCVASAPCGSTRHTFDGFPASSASSVLRIVLMNDPEAVSPCP